MNTGKVLKELETYGDEQTKKIYLRHGARDPLYGVKIGDINKIAKKIKRDHNLALDLYATGNSDAMYLAGLIGDPNLVTKDELRCWVRNAYWYMLSEYTVSNLTALSPYGWVLGLEWINSGDEMTETAGWSTLSRWISVKPENELHLDTIMQLLELITEEIHTSKNRVRYSMNGFVIAVGSYVPGLSNQALEAARQIGKVLVDMGETTCNVPIAKEYIKKALSRKKNKPG